MQNQMHDESGTWKEVGNRLVKDKEPVRFIEMELKRIGECG